MPDIHFHDVYAHFEDDAFKGLNTKTAQGEQFATIRSMRAQLHSTRLFNENYFALHAALDDIAKRGIKYVALPGDFSDDGQPLHVRGLKKILDKYHADYGIEFFAAPGNHDPTRPISLAAGKPDYLAADGKEQAIFSMQHPLCQQATANKTDAHAVICSDEVQELGYKPIMDLLGQHGFYPKENYLYFETPFSRYNNNNYSYAMAEEQAQFEQRHYDICHQGAGGKFRQADYTDCFSVADTSYLVEPVNGLWLLAIDANVYQPKKNGTGDAMDADNFLGSSNAGYNKVITHKTHLLEWIENVVQRAKEQQKTLIAFSHFPMHEFYNGAADTIGELLGEEKLQLNRNPHTATSKALADTGLGVHVAGHMHINDTGVYRGENGKVLFNIQAPSLAAYIPAYKILTITTAQQIEVETVIVDEVPRFAELFPHYLNEWSHLNAAKDESLWNKDILQARNYLEFTEWHLRELARLRFLPQEWPADVRELLRSLNGAQMLVLSQLPASVNAEQLRLMLEKTNRDKQLADIWTSAYQRAEKIAHDKGFTLANFAGWSGQDLSMDFYRLWSADQLALRDIDPERMRQYELLAQHFPDNSAGHGQEATNEPRNVYQRQLGQLLAILLQFSRGAPSDHFRLNLEEGTIDAL